MGILNLALNNINLDDNFDDYSELLSTSDFWLGKLNLKSAKSVKRYINEELMPIVSYPKKWWDFCMSEDVYNLRVLEPFVTRNLL